MRRAALSRGCSQTQPAWSRTSGSADAIVTGDTDLLALHPFLGIPILTPKDFLGREWNSLSG